MNLVVRDCQFITLSEILSEEEYELISSIIANKFTWGDTAVVLVGQEVLRRVLQYRFGAELDSDELMAAAKVISVLDQLEDDVFVNLY